MIVTRLIRSFFFFTIAGLVSLLPVGGSPAAQTTRWHLVIVVDGLRPDYVTPEVMPRLTRLGRRGIVFNAHHSVFPTVTRVNASSFVTGAYPETHGLLGNTIYIPSVNRSRGLDTGQHERLQEVAKAEGKLLTARALGEILERAGKKLLVVSSGSSGSALLLNPATEDGPIVNVDFIRPPALVKQVHAAIGKVPAHATPNDGQNQYAIDAYLMVGLTDLHPDVTMMWLNDPDGTAHANGIGTELTRRSLALVDAGIGRIEDALAAKGLLAQTNIIVTSDHGFSTHTGGVRIEEILKPLTNTTPNGSDIVVAEGAVYMRGGHDRTRLATIVAALQKHKDVGAIFTRGTPGGGSEGEIPGTLSFDVARWHHPRSGDVLVSANWTSDANAAGFKGTTSQNGVAGHGASSPFDIHNTLIAAGPDFREGTTSAVPTGNVDVAPTLLHLLGLPVPSTMTGRVILEGLRTGPLPSTIAVEHRAETVQTRDGSYRLTANLSIVGGKRYLDSTEVTRGGIADRPRE